ncbi:MAG: rhomboid family intramembrane serine protease [Chitinophagaceae bacterium]
MNKLHEKVRLIFLPFLLIAAGFILLYSFLNWLLLIQSGLVSLKEDIVNFWLPFLLPWIPALIWLRPRIKLLKFKKDNGSFALLFIATLLIALPTILAQQYLETATGKLTRLDNTGQLDQARPTKYYSLNEYYIDKSQAGIRAVSTVSGKYNRDLNFAMYVTLPILVSAADTAGTETVCWLGKKYSETISNKISDAEKNEKYKLFAERVQTEFDSTDFSRFSYLEKAGNTDDHDEFDKAIQSSPVAAGKAPIVLLPRQGAFADRNGSMPAWILLAFGGGLVAWFLLLLLFKFDEAALNKFRQGIRTSDPDTHEFFSLFIPKQGFFVTPVIINLNIIMYLAMVVGGLGLISFRAYDLLNWGGNYRPVTTQGQWWRLLSSVFLHGGLLHLLANMAGLLFAGFFLEPLLGRFRFALIYLVTGILASAASIWWHPATVSIGASGAIFGLDGLLLALLLLKAFSKTLGKPLLISTAVFVGYNLLMGLTGGVDNAAHIGGLVSGFLIGCLLAPGLRRQSAQHHTGKADGTTSYFS